MRRLIPAILCFASLCSGAISLDKWTRGGDNSGGGTVSWSHNNGCVSHCIGIVTISSLTNPAMTLTWGGTAMTLMSSHATAYTGNGAGYSYIYCLVAPPSGTATISGSASGWMIGASGTYSGAQQSCTPDATGFEEQATGNCPVGSAGYQCPVALTVGSAGSWVIGMFGAAPSQLYITTAAGTQRTGTNYGQYNVFDSAGPVSSGSYTMLAADGTVAPNYSELVVSITPYTTAAPTAVTANPTVITVGPQ